MRLLVCGDRNWTDLAMIALLINELKPTAVIEGEARGADRLARVAARHLNIPVEAYPAQWDTYGKRAGPVRNQLMLDEGKPDLVVAFHDSINTSRGTADMLRRAKLAGVPTKLYSHTK